MNKTKSTPALPLPTTVKWAVAFSSGFSLIPTGLCCYKQYFADLTFTGDAHTPDASELQSCWFESGDALFGCDSATISSVWSVGSSSSIPSSMTPSSFALFARGTRGGSAGLEHEGRFFNAK